MKTLNATFRSVGLQTPLMTNAIIAYQDAPITTAADSDNMLVQLFVATKRSEKTRVQYSQ